MIAIDNYHTDSMLDQPMNKFCCTADSAGIWSRPVEEVASNYHNIHGRLLVHNGFDHAGNSILYIHLSDITPWSLTLLRGLKHKTCRPCKSKMDVSKVQ